VFPGLCRPGEAVGEAEGNWKTVKVPALIIQTSACEWLVTTVAQGGKDSM